MVLGVCWLGPEASSDAQIFLRLRGNHKGAGRPCQSSDPGDETRLKTTACYLKEEFCVGHNALSLFLFKLYYSLACLNTTITVILTLLLPVAPSL